MANNTSHLEHVALAKQILQSMNPVVQIWAGDEHLLLLYQYVHILQVLCIVEDITDALC